MYFITVITNLVPYDAPHDDERWGRQTVHCVGYFHDLSEAMKNVDANWEIISNEFEYEYLVIEQIREGLFPIPLDEHWFRYDGKSNRYEQIQKPVETNKILNWAF